MSDTIRWAILGTGDIARQFATDLGQVEGAELLAVGSRRQETADRFGTTHGIPRCYPSYEAVVADPEVDVVYIGTPHAYHAANSLLCLDAGKPILCEKPFALNARQAETVIARARERQLFCMEAMWTFCFPAMEKLEALIAEGALGAVRWCRAGFSFRADYEADSRIYDPALGGGSLLDVGIYPVALAQRLLGSAPTVIQSTVCKATGVDEEAAVLLQFASGAQAMLSSSLRVDEPQQALIVGEDGYVRFDDRFFEPRAFTLVTKRGEQRFTFESGNLGYCYEAREVGRCLRAGQIESPRVPLAGTLAVMRTLDALRAQWGLRYPDE
jgi:predicted dehydrogenase